MKLSKLDLAAERMEKLDWSNHYVYSEFIAQVYYFVRHSTRMLGYAMSLTTNQAYYDRLVAHIKEEDKHEFLALKDLSNLGQDLVGFPETGMTRAMWEPQFYKIQKSPTSLLGYILALELISVRVYPLIRPVLNNTYKANSLNFIRVHSDEDPDHVEKALSQLEHLSGVEKTLAIENFEQTCDVLTAFFDEISQRAERRSSAQMPPQAA